jgi:hypothetical protein
LIFSARSSTDDGPFSAISSISADIGSSLSLSPVPSPVGGGEALRGAALRGSPLLGSAPRVSARRGAAPGGAAPRASDPRGSPV